MTEPVAVTGIGAVSAAGLGHAALWDAVAAGRTAVRQLTGDAFRNNHVRIAAALPGFDPAAHLPAESLRTIDRFTAFALVAAAEALAMAGLDQVELGDRTAVIIGTGIGGAETSDAGSAAYYLGQTRPDPMSIPKIMPNAAASQISMRYKARGPVLAVSSACSSSAQAAGLGLQLIRAGIVDRAIVGGAEAMLTPSVMRAWELLRVLSPGGSRPFSSGRDGMVLGEGAAMLVLEREADARARGATPLARLAGYGTTSDAGDLLRPDPAGAARAMRLALDDAGLAPDAIGYVNAHGTGTVFNDTAETEALRSVFGPHLEQLPVSSTKPVHGHTIGAAGAIELVVTIMALRHQLAPPTINWQGPDPRCLPDPVPNTARPAAVRAAMTNSFAFGGINASLVVTA